MPKFYDKDGKFLGYVQDKDNSLQGSPTFCDKDGKFLGYILDNDNKFQGSPTLSPKQVSGPAPFTPKAEERSQERLDEMALKYAVEMQKLEFEKEKSEKNRGLLFFALLMLAAFIVGYCLFR